MSTELVHIFHLATGNASGNSRLMKDRLYINSVNLHHRFFAEESWIRNLALHEVKIIATL